MLHDVVHGAVGDINIPGKHAFLFERILEFNASVPYAGFSGAFLEQMNRPGRFDKEARRRAFDTMEALFCLLPEAKKVRSQINPVAYKTAGIVPSGIRKSLPTNQEYFYLRVSNCRALVGRLHRLRRRMVLARGRSVLLNSLCACTASQCASRHSTLTSFLRVVMQGL